MKTKKGGLGNRSLNALLAGSRVATMPTAASQPPDNELSEIPVDQVQRGQYQPRREMDNAALEELAQSIRQQGIVQPILVRPIGADRYEIIAGERRWRAAQLAELNTVPAVIQDVGDEAALAMALIENIQREDLNPLEEAAALQRLQAEFGLTQHQVAEAVGKSRTAVTNLLRLLNLAEPVRRMLEHGDLEMGHGRALLSLDSEQQLQIATQVVGRALSVRQTEELVRRQSKEKPARTNASMPRDPDLLKLEESVADRIGAHVRISHNRKGKGKLVIQYNSLDELEGIISHFGTAG